MGEAFWTAVWSSLRGTDGVAQALSAYCPHLNTDLGAGTGVDDPMVCPLRRWPFDRAGVCTQTGTGCTVRG
ncbi:Rieske 2Fe-2S domain-containing protein [Streptomyces sp. NBC_01233]|uniref:Rieske 2Fe-2S domain-containing protein n=1 Tax=Streptomyces sp. NBC_01233 TaxID=2903787 RepID=UPI003FA3804D